MSHKVHITRVSSLADPGCGLCGPELHMRTSEDVPGPVGFCSISSETFRSLLFPSKGFLRFSCLRVTQLEGVTTAQILKPSEANNVRDFGL